jgi:hypothetical protein
MREMEKNGGVAVNCVEELAHVERISAVDC